MLRVARYHPAYRRDLLNWRRNSDLADTQNAVGPIHLSTPEFAVHSATGIRRRGNLKNPKAGKIRAPNTSVASIQCMYLGEWRAKCVSWSWLVCSLADPLLDSRCTQGGHWADLGSRSASPRLQLSTRTNHARPKLIGCIDPMHVPRRMVG